MAAIIGYNSDSNQEIYGQLREWPPVLGVMNSPRVWKTRIIDAIVHGVVFSVTVLCFSALTVLIAQSLNTFAAGDLVSAAQMNANFTVIDNRINTLDSTVQSNHQIAAPQGAIMAFYLSACPTGWVPADGTGSTPDLRGVFVRGLNSFDGGTTSHIRDVDGNNASRGLGSYQADMFAAHNHDIRIYGGGPFNGLNDSVYVGSHHADFGGTIANRGGTETRSKNVALIYCMRKD